MISARYIIIEGNIGSGKTSLANLLYQKLGGELVLEEFADNSFLPRFYENPDRWAFPLELSFLADRYKQMKKVFEHAKLHNKLIISDYMFDKSFIFASNTLEHNELELYRNFFEIVNENIPQPDLIVYLNNSIDNLLQNISNRNRDYEKNIKKEYLEKISAGYNQFMKSGNHLNILNIDCSSIDFVNNSNHLQLITEKIDEALKNNRKTLFSAF